MAIEKFRRGAFILLEGCDRSGKSTQCERLVKVLQEKTKQPVQLVKFPDRTTAIGKSIHAYLSETSNMEDHVIHLLFSANRWEAMERLKTLLLSGTHLVVDRYAYSGVAFSRAKGMDLKWCKSCDVGLLRPDVTIFLDVAVETARLRGGFGEERYEKEEFQRRVRDIFMEELMEKDTWKVVDGGKSMDEVSADIFRIAAGTIEQSEGKALSYDLFQ